MKNFYFHVPTKVFFGKSMIENLPPEIERFGKNVLLVYGGGSIKRVGLYNELITLLTQNGIALIELGGVLPNPHIDSVRVGVELCKMHDTDVVLAVGGGSAIDCAKAIAAARFYEGDPWDLVLDKEKISAVLPVMAVLTIAGTGSEMDCGSVITNPETREKYDFDNSNMFPVCTILDPTYTFSVPAYYTATGTVDIMSHIFEAYFSRELGYIQDRIAEGLLKTCIEYGTVAIREPENYEARANLMWASSWAINGLTSCGKGQAWSVHQIEHMISGYYDLTHGAGLAILTPNWMEYVLDDSSAKKFAEYGINVWGIDSSLDVYKIAKEGIEKTRKCFTDWGMPTSLSEVGIDDRYFAEMAEKAAVRGLDKAYRPLYKDDITKILQMSL